MVRLHPGWILALFACVIPYPARAQAPSPAAGAPVTPTPPIAAGPVTGADRPAITKTLMESRQNLNLQLRKSEQERTVPVPPVLEIEVLDPKVDPLGNPAVLTQVDANNHLVVEIPPVVLVHRYYYTGDRSFQGPLIPGGPSIIVVNHPTTGERLYVELQLLPGAPRVRYTRHSIEYDYGFQAITLKFGLCGKPTVLYRQGTPLLTRVEMAREHTRTSVSDFVQRTGLPAASQKVHAGVKNVCETTADRVRQVGKMAVTPVLQIVKMTPLSNAFTTSAEQRATQQRDVAVQRAQAVIQKGQSDIPTLR